MTAITKDMSIGEAMGNCSQRCAASPPSVQPGHNGKIAPLFLSATENRTHYYADPVAVKIIASATRRGRGFEACGILLFRRRSPENGDPDLLALMNEARDHMGKTAIRA